MARPRIPDDLDRRVYDLAVQRIPLAEIAVRLGVSVAEADERIQRICARLGVPDREALRKLAVVVAEADLQPEPTIAETLAIPEIVPAPKRHSRRAVLAGSASAVALLGGAAAIGLARRQGATPVGPPPMETPLGEQLPTQPAEPFDGMLIEVEGGTNERFESRSWPKDALIDWEHGLFRLFPTTGDVQGLRFIERERRERSVAGFGMYQTGPGGRFVWAQHGSGRAYLMDILVTGQSWSWPIENLRLVAAGGSSPVESWAVFEELDNRQGSGRHRVFSAIPARGFEHVATFQLPPTGFGQPTLFSPDASHLAIWSGTGSSDPQLHLVELRTGRIVQSGHKLSPRDGVIARPLRLDAVDGAFGGFLARWQYPGGEPRFFGQLFGWYGAWVQDGTSRVRRLDWTTAYSRDVQHHLSEASLKHLPIDGADGGREFWTAVSVYKDQDETPEWSMLSASIGYGDGTPPNPWLDDNSGFVAMVRGPEPAGRGWDAYEYAIISPDGRAITRIPLPPVADDRFTWFRANAMRSPAPCPHDPDLIAFGRLQLYNRRTGEWLTANIASDAGPDHLDPWAAGTGQMVFALPHGGHGGGSPPILLTPKRVAGSPQAGFLFVVDRTGNGLNVRIGPAIRTQVLTAIPDGTPVELAEDLKFAVGLRSAQQKDDGTWLHVRTPDGTQGWVSAAYLDWA